MKTLSDTVDLSTVEIDGVDRSDHPDYCDAFISNAYHRDGTKCTDGELEKLTEQFGDLINEMANEQSQGE